MKRFLMVFGLAGLLAGATGCQTTARNHHCNHCQSGGGASAGGKAHGGGLLGKLGWTGTPVGCRPRPLAWQQGGTDYARTLSYGQLRNQAQGPPPQAGPPTATYGYPYYTTRGPRDFLLDEPPSIGP